MGTHVVAAGRRDRHLPGAILRLASDERLVEQVHAGSERAFEVLFERHYLPVLTYSRHMLHSREEAEDVVQQTFLAAYRELVDMQQPIVALRPWLFAIARHRCLSALRAGRARPVEEVLEHAADQLVAEVTTREELRAVLADVAGLPDDQRAAIVLTELGDASHAEIARVLGCSREKVKALAFQARSSLTADRAARDTPCAEIREQLATWRGGALRATVLRRHVRECEGCRAFRDVVQGQRRKQYLLLPLAPFAGLKRALSGAIFGSGGGVPSGAAVGAGALSGTGLAAAALATVVIPVAAAVAVVAAPRDARAPAQPGARVATTAQRAAQATPSTPRAAAGARDAIQILERRAPAGANRGRQRPQDARDDGLARPSQAATPEPERSSGRTEADAEEPPAPARPSDHPNASRKPDRVTPPRDRRATPPKPPKVDGRAKPARSPQANAELRRPAPPKANREPHAAALTDADREPRAVAPPQPNREPRAAEPPKARRETTTAGPPNANGRGHAG